MKIFSLFYVACLLASPIQASDWKLPAVNQGNWTPGTGVGVLGGIAQYQPGGASARTTLIDVTKAPYNADKTGVTSCTAAVAMAVNDAKAGTVVYFPEGNYLCNISLNYAKDEVTVRGAGPGLTTITGQITVGTDLPFNFGAQTVTGTKTKGTAALTVPNPGSFATREMVYLTVEDERDKTRITGGATPVFHVAGYDGGRNCVAIVRSVNGSTVTIDPPLMFDASNLAVTVSKAQVPFLLTERAGVENLTLSMNAAFGIYVQGTSECWVDNVKIINGGAYGIFINHSHRMQLDRVDANGPGKNSSNNAGLLVERSSCCLIQNNSFNNFMPGLEANKGCTNNAFLYNAFFGEVLVAMDVNHGPHNSVNLYEGNVAWGFMSDGYFGGSSHDTAYRNFFHGCNDSLTAAGGYGNYTVRLCRFTRHYVLAGNVFGRDGVRAPDTQLGYPFMGAGGTHTGTAQPSTGDFWEDWGITGTLTTRLSDNRAEVTINKPGSSLATGFGVGGNAVVLFWTGGYRSNMAVESLTGTLARLGPNPYGTGFLDSGDKLPAASSAMKVYTNSNGYSEKDLDVEATTTFTGNYHSAVGTGSLQNASGDPLPASLAYTTKPAWFGDLAWPPVDPLNPRFDVAIIPAGYRFKHGTNPPGTPTVSAMAPVKPAKPTQIQTALGK